MRIACKQRQSCLKRASGYTIHEMSRTRVVLIGAGFIADIHAESYHRFVPDAELVGVYSRSEEHARAFARKHGIARWFTDLEEALAQADCDVVDICVPNHLHARVTIEAANAGKHVIIEKPLCLTLEEADEMIAACKAHNRKLMYAEELCFAPKYERVRQLVREGAVGSVYYMRQCEKHSGPHSDWFYDLDQSGGGALMDMGCHGFAWFRWMLGAETRALSVYAQMQTGPHPQRPDALRRELALYRRVRRRHGRHRRKQLGEAWRNGGPGRSVRHGRRRVCRLVHGEFRVDLQRKGLWLRDGESRLDTRAGPSPISRKRSIRDIRRS